ncbi:Flp pilus assembly complex ATPase component TadA [Myxococcota bacterium]|nr:Flp pilus assembly complex ATPase component TadA [Myxococcota bacterium]MBU1900669.1 Flp pilus assembly complex ATPase component TadA [Myxococcota bacterium]
MEALIGRLAIQHGMLTMEQLAEATRLQARKRDGRRLGQVLIELGFLDFEQLNALLAEQRRAFEAGRLPSSLPRTPHLTSAPPRDPLASILREANARAATDVHLRFDQPAWLRIGAELEPATAAPIAEVDLEARLSAATWAALADEGQAVEIIEGDGWGRWRLRLTRQGEGVLISARRLMALPELGALGLPGRLALLTNHAQGLFLVTGPRGSGKSTTLAALLRILSEERAAHAIALGGLDLPPLEPRRALIDVWPMPAPQDIAAISRAALRLNPDVLIFDPLRCEQGVEAALRAAERGCLVFASVASTSLEEALTRLLIRGPAARRAWRAAALADQLLGVLEQRLMPRAQGPGRVLAWGLTLSTPSLAHALRAQRLSGVEAQLGARASAAMGGRHVALRETLARLVKEGLIDAGAAGIKDTPSEVEADG